MPDLTTVAGVESLLQSREAAYKNSCKALLTGWQNDRKHLRALLAVLKDRDAVVKDQDAPADSEDKED